MSQQPRTGAVLPYNFSGQTKSECHLRAMNVFEQEERDKRLKKLLETEEYSDLVVRCGNVELKVHKAVVCTGCEFFKGAVEGGFKESATGVINLPEDDPDVIVRMVSFLYRADYTIDGLTQPDALRMHISLYIIADKYGIPSLKTTAALKFLSSLDLDNAESIPDCLRALFDNISAGKEDEFIRAVVEKCILHGSERIAPGDGTIRQFSLSRGSEADPKVNGPAPTIPILHQPVFQTLLNSNITICSAFLDLSLSIGRETIESVLPFCTTKYDDIAEFLEEGWYEMKVVCKCTNYEMDVTFVDKVKKGDRRGLACDDCGEFVVEF